MPKRKPPSKREPNGRKSRRANSVAVDIDGRKVAWNKEDQDMVSVAIEARQRLFGLSVDKSRDQKAGSFIGRLCIGKELSVPQYEALCMWEESARLNAIMMAGPKGDAAQDPNRTPGRTSFENVPRTIQVTKRHRAAVKAVQEAQNVLRGRSNLFAALYECVQRDREVFHLVGDLKEAANALVRHYGIEARAAA
jgi:hypothetical protein